MAWPNLATALVRGQISHSLRDLFTPKVCGKIRRRRGVIGPPWRRVLLVTALVLLASASFDGADATQPREELAEADRSLRQVIRLRTEDTRLRAQCGIVSENVDAKCPICRKPFDDFVRRIFD